MSFAVDDLSFEIYPAKYRLLIEGETVAASDQVWNCNCDKWEEAVALTGRRYGSPFCSTRFRIRRALNVSSIVLF